MSRPDPVTREMSPCKDCKDRKKPAGASAKSTKIGNHGLTK